MNVLSRPWTLAIKQTFGYYFTSNIGMRNLLLVTMTFLVKYKYIRVHVLHGLDHHMYQGRFTSSLVFHHLFNKQRQSHFHRLEKLLLQEIASVYGWSM